LQCVAACCRVLQCVAVCCSVLQHVAVCCSVLQCVAVCCSVLQHVAVCCSVLQSFAECCSVLQRVVMWVYLVIILDIKPTLLVVAAKISQSQKFSDSQKVRNSPNSALWGGYYS